MDIKIDQLSKDFVLVDGDLTMVGDLVELLMQRLFIRFKTFKRELFWDKTLGIDYINDVFGRSRPKISVDTIFQNSILSEGMVSSLVSFSSSIQGGAYSCSFQVRIANTQQTITGYILTNQDGITLTDQSGKVLTVKFTN